MMNSKKPLMFAYGSNLNQYDLSAYCAKNNIPDCILKKHANAKLNNYALEWNIYSHTRGCGVANIIEKKDQFVWGTLFELEPEVLAVLDKKEGHPNFYCRKEIEVEDENGMHIEAITYQAIPSYTTTAFYPNKDYLKTIIDGAIQQNLPEYYIKELINKTPVDFTSSRGRQKKSAIYSGKGVGKQTIKNWGNLFESHDLGSLTVLYSYLFNEAELIKYDLVILPGGSGLGICAGLGDIGKENLRNYINNGGKLIGVCAGAYAITAEKREYLAVSPLNILDLAHWKRGEAVIPLEITEIGSTFFSIKQKSAPIIFHNGPIVAERHLKNCTNFNVIARFKDEILHPEGEKGLMKNSPAAWTNNYGKGLVVGISPHIERTEEYEYLMAECIIQTFSFV